MLIKSYSYSFKFMISYILVVNLYRFNTHTGVIQCYCILNKKNKSKQEFRVIFHIKLGSIVTLRKLHLYASPLHMVRDNRQPFTCYQA